MVQQHGAELVRLQATDFPRRNEPSYAWGNALSGLLLSPRLRGLWGVSCDQAGLLYDHSGQGRTMTSVGAPGIQQQGISPYHQFGTTANAWYYGRADEAGLDITDYLTVWSWVRFSATSTGQWVLFFSKWLTAGNNLSYLLYKTNLNELAFGISSTGAPAGGVVVVSDAVNYVEGDWLFVVGRFISSAEMKVAIGNARTGILREYINVAGIPAAMFSGTANLEVGRGDGGNYLGGDMALWGLAAFPLSDTDIFNKFHQTRPLYMW